MLLKLRSKYGPFARKWEQKAVIPMAILALLYLAIYSTQVMYSGNLNLVKTLEYISNIIWIIFAADLAIRFIGAENFKYFLKSGWLEIIALTLPFLRVLRMLRVLVAIRGLKLLMHNRSQATGIYILILVPFVWFTGAIAVLDAESTAIESPLTTIGDSLWWSLATITTVGYGDIYPITFEGKFVAAILMITGIALFSAGAGIFASWIMGERK